MMNWYTRDCSAIGGANQAMYDEIEIRSATDLWSSEVCGEGAPQTSPFDNSVAHSHENGWSPLSYVQQPVHNTSPQLTNPSLPLPVRWSTPETLQGPSSDGSTPQQRLDSFSIGPVCSPIVHDPTVADTRHADDAANKDAFVFKKGVSLPLEQVSHTRTLDTRSPEFKTKVKRDAKGNRQHVFRATAKRRAALLPQDRKSTELTRRMGSCARCKRQKIRCNSSGNEYEPCQTCEKIAKSAWHRLFKPCTHIDILNLELHRRGSTTNSELNDWFDAKMQSNGTLLLEDGYSVPLAPTPFKAHLTQHMGLTLEVTLSTFWATEDDILDYPWRDASGNERLLAMPPYFITDMEEAKRNLIKYTTQATPHYFTKLLADANPIVRDTFREACKFAKAQKSHLMASVLHFWAATRITEILWNFTDDNEVGFNRVLESESPWYNTIPITPVMDTQIDELAIRDVLLPLREKILHLLHEKILARRKEDFMEIFLVVFIIMNNFEFILSDVIDYTTRHGMMTSSGGPSLCEGYLHSCKAILSYFHFASDGSIPFNIDDTSATSLPSFVTADQAAYIRHIRQEVQKQESALNTWRQESMYQRPLYWCYQMLINDWKGDIKPACEILPFTEKDFMTS